MDGEFSVCQFFKGGEYDYECRNVDMETACRKFIFLTNNVSAKTGMTERVIITDRGDMTNMEWVHGKGITYPPELVGRVFK